MDVRMPDGTIITNVPDNITQEDLLSRYNLFSGATKERTWTEAAKDIAASGIAGAGALMQFPGQLYGLATGEMPEGGLTKAGKSVEEYGKELKSAALLEKERERAKKIAEAEKEGIAKEFITAAGETIKDPALLTSFLSEQLPQLLVPFGAAKATKAGVLARQAALGVGKEAAEAGAGRLATSAAVGAGATQQAADIAAGAYEDVYKQLIDKGVDPATAKETAISQARAAGASAFVISLLAQRLPGARTIEESFAGVPGVGGRIAGLGKGALGEALSEIAEEGGGKLTQNIALRDIAPETDILKGVGTAAGLAAIGGGTLGGAAGAIRTPAVEAKREVPEAPAREIPVEQVAPEEKALAAFAPTEAPEVPVTPEQAAKPEEVAPEVPTETRIPEPEQEAPRPAEITDLERQVREVSKDLRITETRERGPSLATVLKNRLSEEEVTDISPEPSVARVFKRSEKRGAGERLGNIISSGELNDFLRPEMVINPEDDATVIADKEPAAEEYIKEKIRNRNYLTFDTEMRLEQLGYTLKQIEEQLAKEMTDEQIRAEANSLAAEIAAEEGLSRPEEAPEDGAVRGVAERVTEPGKPEEGIGFKQITPIQPPVKFKTDNPGGEWLKENKKYAESFGRNEFNVPRKFGNTTGYVSRTLLVPVDKLAKVKGMRGEQKNIRTESIEYLTNEMSKTGSLPKYDGEDYAPFIQVYQDGTPYVNEGNHRIMVAKQLGWKYLPLEVRWYNGAEQVKGEFSPETLIKNDLIAHQEGYTLKKYAAKEERPKLELKAETPKETIDRQEKEESERESKERKKIADLERDLFRLESQEQPKEPPVQGKLFDVTNATPTPLLTEQEVTPSFTREFDRLTKQLNQKRITTDVYATKVQDARKKSIEARKLRKPAERVRGADFIRQRLLEAKRRGLIGEEAVELTEWFIKQNPDLVKDLGISIRSSDAGISGMYLPTQRIARLSADTQKTDTAIHEILHHLERMMPEKIRNDISKSWLKNFASEQQKANETKDESVIQYFNLLNDHHSTGKIEPFEKALEMIKNGTVPYQLYQYANPSEFWAVNASRIVQGQFDVRGDRLGALKQWLNKVAQKIKELFGMKSDAPIIRALDSLAKSDGKFVSTEMLASSGIYPNIQTNVFGNKPVDPTWGRPDDSKVDDVVFVLQDKMIDTKKVLQEIERIRGKLKDRWDAYLQEELYHGRTAKKTNDFLEDELAPLIKEIRNKGFTIADVEEYLHNRHAEERNIQNAKLKGGMEDGGSGILTEDAKKYLAELDPTKRKNLESIANKIDAITKKTRQILVENGLEEKKTIDAWEKAYKHYVPLNREENDYEVSNIGKGVGKGFNVRGSFSKRAAGSAREVVDILANIAMQRERAIVRNEKTRVSQAVYGLAVQHPNTDFWLAVDPQAIKDPEQTIRDLESLGIDGQAALNIMKEPTQTYVDPNTGTVSQRINQSLRGAENVLAVRVNGKDKFVFFNTKDPRAVRMVSALKNLDADQLSRATAMIGRITRYFASINTQFNPIFGVINFIRDYQGAAFNLMDTPISDKAKQVLKDAWPAWYGIYGDIRSRRKGAGPKASNWSDLWEEYQTEGGQTGFRDQFSRSQERAEALQKLLDPASWADTKLGKIFTINGTLKVPFETARKTAEPLFNWLSDYNQTMENAVRLAAYKAGLDKGLSKQRAASVAKNLTVNFNRKGQIARQAGAWYAFFNASVQGTARMYQTIKGPAGKAIFWGGLLVGSAQAMALAFAGFGEDEPPDFIKEKNFIIPLPGTDKKYLTVPMPLGFNVIPNTSRIMTEWAMSGGKDTSKRVAQIFGALLEAFNPVGNAGWSFQTFAPTVFDPAVALFENKDWTGKPIAKKDISELDPTPGYTRAKETASWFSKNLAEFLNFVTGGTKYRPGVVSPTPDQIDYLVGQITGGVGREVMKVEQVITSAMTGEELPSYKIPLVGRFYGETQSQAAQRDRFYNNIKLLNEHENEIKGRRKAGEPVEDYIRENPESRLFGAANGVEKTIQNLRNRREDMIKKGAPKEDVKDIEKRITDLMIRFNERVTTAKESAK